MLMLFMSCILHKKIHQLMLNVSGFTTHPKKFKTSDHYKELETNFMQDTDKLFDIFCYDDKQRKECKIQYGLKMTSDDHVFFLRSKSRTQG